LYFPLGGSKGGMWMKIRNTFIIFLVSGFWHGANWTFLVWGFLNTLYIIPSIVFSTNRNNLDIVASGKYLPTIKEFFAIGITFSLTVFAWIFFRAENMEHALSYISQIFSSSLFTFPEFEGMIKALTTIFLILFFILIEWQGREKQYAIEHFSSKLKQPFRYMFYYFIIIIIFLFGGKEQQFIYFQF
jgi:D-alanyl-lipoteichoic acid acyltransferase DltB (MBOAT superfamily)